MSDSCYTKDELKQIEIDLCWEYIEELPDDCIHCYFKRINDPADPTRYFKCVVTNENVYAGPCRPYCVSIDFTKYLLEIL